VYFIIHSSILVVEEIFVVLPSSALQLLCVCVEEICVVQSSSNSLALEDEHHMQMNPTTNNPTSP
jgi:hypothetical protein